LKKTRISVHQSLNTATLTKYLGFNCDQCNRVFQHKSSLSVHKDGFRKDASNHLALKTINLHLGTVILKTKYKRSHSNHKPYQCNICGERFSQMNYLKNHQAVHADLQVQSDGIETSMPINDPSELNEMKNDEVQRKKKHECSICKHRTTSKADLERHKRTHTGEKPFKCDFCEKRYGRKEDLASHKRTHTGEKPFKCEFCDKAFIRKDKLTAHGLVHTGERPHECDRCGRRFARLDNLKAHYRK